MNGGAVALAGVGREAEANFKERAREWVGGTDLVSREEFEAVKAMAAAVNDEVDALRAKIAELEKRSK